MYASDEFKSSYFLAFFLELTQLIIQGIVRKKAIAENTNDLLNTKQYKPKRAIDIRRLAMYLRLSNCLSSALYERLISKNL